ncbi:hypothetical protein BC941DRAFT_436440 [Chlamydoabsidia padenii]|nr:hypothetical protein BC941DRAFT_436440 [Chlamydoabsidia padenii]
MASLLWTTKQQQQQRAPNNVLFTHLSPRQVANKAYNLAIKKLERDDKRSRPRYNVRERLLLCHTITKAEQFLQKRTVRTNRRVMAFENDDDDDIENPTNAIHQHQQQQQQQQQQHDDLQHHLVAYHSPLAEGSSPQSPLLPMGNNAFVIPQDDDDYLQYPSLLTVPTQSTTDCRSSIQTTNNTHQHLTSLITSII